MSGWVAGAECPSPMAIAFDAGAFCPSHPSLATCHISNIGKLFRQRSNADGWNIPLRLGKPISRLARNPLRKSPRLEHGARSQTSRRTFPSRKVSLRCVRCLCSSDSKTRGGVSCDNHSTTMPPAFEVMSKRRRGYPERNPREARAEDCPRRQGTPRTARPQ